MTTPAPVDTVDVWLIPTHQPAYILAELEALLDSEERLRAAAFAEPADRQRFTTAHGVARIVLGRRLGTAPGDLTWHRGVHGKPELAGIRANLSTCAHWAMLAVTDEREVGVDLEALPSDAVALRVSARFFPPAEARFVAHPAVDGTHADGPAGRFARLWTRKEAFVKARGGRLVQGMGLPTRGPGPLLVRDPAGACLVRDLPAPSHYRAAVALEGEQPYAVRWQTWRNSFEN